MSMYGEVKTNSSNRGGNARNSKCVHPKRIERQEGAKARKALSDLLTPQERLTRLDTAFGVGQGAKKERARLERLLKTPKQVQAAK